MKIVEINSVLYGSTGNIALSISKMAKSRGHDVLVCAPKGRHNSRLQNGVLLFGSRLSEDSHLILSRLTGLNGSFSIIATWFLIKRIKKINPDIIHLHNLHNSYINLPLLFRYIKKEEKHVVWTLHDCWAFTGHCPHFLLSKCNKWKTGCGKCPQYRDYPQSFVDTTALTWKFKKKWFSNLPYLCIVTPSEWLKELVNQSFLSKYPVRVINNGIDLKVFKNTKSDFRSKYGIGDSQIVLLGVSYGWNYSKGIDVFMDLYKRLDKNRFRIVIVGTDASIEKEIPKEIITIRKTNNKKELVEIYSAANIFINPTREDNYPTVNMEAIACGTPVISFKTGGSSETIPEGTGETVLCDDIDQLENEIYNVVGNKTYKDNCIKAAKKFDSTDRFNEYVDLYELIIKAGKRLEQ